MGVAIGIWGLRSWRGIGGGFGGVGGDFIRSEDYLFGWLAGWLAG